MKIAPSLLSADFSALGAATRMATHAGADWIHLDVMDGHFVPALTFGASMVSALKTQTHLPLDVHLMIDNPAEKIDDYITAGADHITLHIEACVESPLPLIEHIQKHGCKAGISLKPSTPLEAIKDILAHIDLVLVMSVEPGAGGQKLIPEMLERVRDIKKLAPDLTVVIDGGVNMETAPRCKKAGVDVAVAGSAVFGSDDIKAAISKLKA